MRQRSALDRSAIDEEDYHKNKNLFYVVVIILKNI
jgi:hypothetical protein